MRGDNGRVSHHHRRRFSALQRIIEVSACIGDIPQTPLRVFLQAALQKARDHWGRCRGKRRPVRLASQDRRNRVRHRLAWKRRMAGQHFVQHTAKCPDVGALVDGLPSRLLRTHVGRRAEDGPFLRAAHGHGRRLQLAGRRLREAEVQHLHDAVRSDFDIRRFEIPVNDPFLVRGVERIGDLTRDRERVC